MTRAKLLTLLQQEIERSDSSQAAWAETHGVSSQYVSMVRRRQAAPGDKILAALADSISTSTDEATIERHENYVVLWKPRRTKQLTKS
jgi:hypothetical protein